MFCRNRSSQFFENRSRKDLRTMATRIEQQVALDEALVPSTKRLRIGRSNFRLPSDIQSKKSTLQVVYDVLYGCPFFKAFLVTADVPEIYMQEYQNTQQYGAILPIELTTEDIRNTKAYKEYYACATEEAAPKPKASARRKMSDSDTFITPPTAIPTLITTVAAAPRLTAAVKGKQPAKAKSLFDPSEAARTEAEQLKIVLRRSRQKTHISQHGGSYTDEGIGSKPGVSDVPSDDLEEEISWNSSDDEDVDAQDKDINDDEGDKNDEKDTESGEGDDEETKSDEESAEEETREEEEESFDLIPRTPEDSEDDGNGEEDPGLRVSEEQRLIEEEEADKLYRDVDINQGRGLQVSQDIKDSHVTLTLVHPDGQQKSSPVSSFVTSMLNPISDAGVESIFMTASSSVAPLPTPIPTMNPSIITTVTTTSHPPIPPTPIPSKVLQNLPTFDSVFQFNERLKSLEASFSEYLKTNPFAKAVSNIPVAADMSEIKLKKILIEKMEGNKSIQRSDEQRNLYKALVDAYKADKTILDSYGETAILKRRHEDDDDKEGPSAGSDRGSKRRREGGEPESARALLEPITRSAGRSTTGSKSRQVSASESAFAEEPVQTISQIEEPSHPKPPTPDHDWNKTLPAVQGSAQTWISELAKQADSRSSFNEFLDTPINFSDFIMNRLCIDTLTPELLAGPTYELMRGVMHIKWIEDLVPRTMWIQEPLNYNKHALWGVSHWGWKRQQFYEFAVNWESALDRRIIAVTDLKIVEWHNYKHLDWISIHHDDDKICKFKEGDFKRLHLQDIEDMLLLLAQGKLSNLTVEERFAFNVSLRMFTRSIVIQRCMEDLQLGVKSYQKRLNLTKPNTDGTLNDVRNALDDCLKGIRMQYLPQTIWRKGDKDRAAAMIQAIDKMIKTRRIMRSLEWFVGGRLYEGDFWMLQRTI
nr:hypothetical protein [Tanacetum cinerariifolium]